mgnify:CR=1 FL=1
MPEHITQFGQRLQELREEHSRIEMDLSRAPEDEKLVPFHAAIECLQSEIAAKRQQQAQNEREIGALQFRRGEQARQLQNVAAQLAAAQASERQLALAERSRLVLRAYRDALTRQRLDALEKAFLRAFNTMCRKEDLLSAVYINPGDFSVQLQDADGCRVELADFSAGERQLYALALLWALRQVSGRRLPLVMDMPLVRLDEEHRLRLVRDYLPAVSDQVVLFVTDAELDNALLDEVKPYLARVYRLNYDSELERTCVTLEWPISEGEA